MFDKCMNLQKNLKNLNLDVKQLSEAELFSLILDVEFEAVDKGNKVSYRDSFDFFDQLIERTEDAKIVARLKALQELLYRLRIKQNYGLHFNRMRIYSSKDVFELFYPLLKNKEQEHVFLLLLDSANQIVKKELLYIGTLNQTIIHPREILKGIIKYPCACFILVHNHPSGDPAPSLEDKKVTQRLTKVADLIQVPLVDHIIIGDCNYYSFKDNELI